MIKSYDFSKFKKFGLTERDFKYNFKRINSCGSPEIINDNKVEVIVEKFNLSISCFKTKSQLKNKDIALDMIYILLDNYM